MSDAYDPLPSDAPTRADPHGQAALLLVESLIHGLTARSILSIEEAIEIMEIALDAQIAITEDPRSTSKARPQGVRLLSDLIASLKTDLRAPPYR